MADEQQYPNPNESLFSDISVKLRDIEEKQNIIKDRVLLIGENLISEKEGVDIEIQEIKASIMKNEEDIRRLKLAIERIIGETQNFVRKNEFEILQRQFKMFEPLELARISDVKDMIEKALNTNSPKG
jgi:hypothetical protein